MSVAPGPGTGGAAPIGNTTLPAPGNTPAWIVICNGANITALLKDRMLTIRITDVAGEESDSAELVIDDRDKRVPLPPDGAELRISMGYADRGTLIDKGIFTVDECELSCPPRTVVIKASAARVSPTVLKELRTQSWHKTTLSEIAQTIAQRNGLGYMPLEYKTDVDIKHEDQTNESDLSFLTRLAHKYKVTVKPRNAELVITPRGSGAIGPDLMFNEWETTRWRARIKDRALYGKVEGKYLDRDTNTEKVVSGGSGAETDPVYQVKELFRDKNEAEIGVASKLQGLTSGVVAVELEMEGRPEVVAEGTITLKGFRPEVDDQPWNTKQVVHEISSGSGYITSISCGSPGDEVESWGSQSSSSSDLGTGGMDVADTTEEIDFLDQTLP